jgi:hypothetical protein
MNRNIIFSEQKYYFLLTECSNFLHVHTLADGERGKERDLENQ